MSDANVSITTSDELETSFAGPALLANKFILSLGPFGLKISFLEQSSDLKSYFRTAVVLSMQDGIALHKTLANLMKEAEIALDQAIADQNKK